MNNWPSQQDQNLQPPGAEIRTLYRQLWTVRVGGSIVDPLTLQNVPSPVRGEMLPHSVQAFFVVPALSPLFKERVDDHR